LKAVHYFKKILPLIHSKSSHLAAPKSIMTGILPFTCSWIFLFGPSLALVAEMKKKALLWTQSSLLVVDN